MRSYRSTTVAAEDKIAMRFHGEDARKWSIADDLVRERDGDQEHDHNESDRISIKLFPIDVDTHRTALLFAEATMKQ